MGFKHLRGKHDQRDHGRRGIGQGSGGVSSAVASVTSLDSKETSSITEDARRASLDSFRSSIGDPRPDQDKGEYLDTIRSQLNTSTQEMRDQVKQRNALQRTIDRRVKKGGEPASQSERDQIRALDEGILSRAASSEFLREQYNARLGEFRQERQQALREQRRQEREKKRNNQQQSAAPNTPVKPASYLSEGIITSDVSPIDIDGLPSMDYVRVGTNNIQTINDATRFLDDGGDISGVPDDFLLEAIRGSSRFTQENAGWAGVNGAPTIFTDTRTGRRYLSKYEQTSYAPNEDIAEVLGNNIAVS